MHTRIWDQFLTERDKQIFAGAGYCKRAGFGERPVVLLIDVNYNFVGDRPQPITESIKRWRNSCGAEGWQAAERIRRLADTARARGVPTIYSTGMPGRADGFDRGRWQDKNTRSAEDLTAQRTDGNTITPQTDGNAIIPRTDGNTIIPPIAPRREDIVIEKGKPSVFFGTLLAAYLVDLQADSIIACGTTTSGCVRATVIDGFSYNYRMSVVEECTFDRGQASHALSLFDMHQKYADVVSLSTAV